MKNVFGTHPTKDALKSISSTIGNKTNFVGIFIWQSNTLGKAKIKKFNKKIIVTLSEPNSTLPHHIFRQPQDITSNNVSFMIPWKRLNYKNIFKLITSYPLPIIHISAIVNHLWIVPFDCLTFWFLPEV